MASNQRGIVVIPKILVNAAGCLAGPGELDPSYLRQCVLLWDVIDCPNGVIAEGISLDKNRHDLDILEQAGMFRRTRGHFLRKEGGQLQLLSGWDAPRECWRVAQLATYRKYVDAGEDWVIGQNSERLIVPAPEVSDFRFVETGEDGHSKPGRMTSVPSDLVYSPPVDLTPRSAVELELLKVFPVPRADIPMEEVLEFKEKRKDQHRLFRLKLGEMYQAVLAAPHRERALEDAIDNLVMARDELCRVMDESGISRVWGGVKAEFAVTESVLGLLGGGGVLAYTLNRLGVSPEAAVPAGVLLPVISLGLERAVFRPPVISEELKPWAYVYYVDKELG